MGLGSLVSDLRACDTILFLCSGNIIRSAFAGIYAQHIGIDRKIITAGTVYHNTRITSEARSRLIKIGVDGSLINGFSPTHISEIAVIPEKTVIFGMKRHHIQGFDNYPKYLLSEINEKNEEIADPYFEGNFEGVFDHIQGLVDKLNELL